MVSSLIKTFVYFSNVMKNIRTLNKILIREMIKLNYKVELTNKLNKVNKF